MFDREWGGEEDGQHTRGWADEAAAGSSATETATVIAGRSRQAYQAPCEGGQSRRRRRVMLRSGTDKFPIMRNTCHEKVPSTYEQDNQVPFSLPGSRFLPRISLALEGASSVGHNDSEEASYKGYSRPGSAVGDQERKAGTC